MILASLCLVVLKQTDLCKVELLNWKVTLSSVDPPVQGLLWSAGLRVVHGGQRWEDPPGQVLLCPSEGVFWWHRGSQESLCG